MTSQNENFDTNDAEHDQVWNDTMIRQAEQVRSQVGNRMDTSYTDSNAPRLYPMVTIEIRGLYMQLWQGCAVSPAWDAPFPKSDLFIQGEDEIEAILENLTAVERESADGGYLTRVSTISDEYFSGLQDKANDQRMKRNAEMVKREFGK